jgi:hypothetical protein
MIRIVRLGTPCTSSAGVLIILALANCGPTKRFDQDLEGREKVFAVWFRTDVSHVRRVLPAPIESVWQVLPSSFQSLRFPAAPSVYPDEHVYVTPHLKVEHRLYEGESNSLYLDCGHTTGGVPAADAYQVIFAIMAKLTPHASGGTEIDIIIDGTAQDMTQRSLPVRCNGTGRFEEAIIQRLQAGLRSQIR